jgi:hypothetical protein
VHRENQFVVHKRGTDIGLECKAFLSPDDVELAERLHKRGAAVSYTMTQWTKLCFPDYQHGSIVLSIVAGRGRYSAPGIDLFTAPEGGWPCTLDGYTHLELALMAWKGNGFVRPADHQTAFPFEWAKEWTDDVKGGVPREQAQRIADDLASLCLAELSN